MTAPARLYAGSVMHVRHMPFRHRFDYRIWMLAIDLDRISEVVKKSRWFRHNRRGLIALHDRDHGNRDGSSLRSYAEAALQARGLQEYRHKIIFITTPRLLGYAFNPISFYYCYDAAGRLGAVLHQVKNTFGGQIGYVMPVDDSRVIRQQVGKRMHVSPFFDMAGGYRFALSRPEEKLTVSIHYGTREQKRMTATMVLQERAFSDSSLLRLLAEIPFAPMKVILAIHWQALRLWLRGAKFHSAPQEKHEPVIAGESS
jgi:DUF1365 family protein